MDRHKKIVPDYSDTTLKVWLLGMFDPEDPMEAEDALRSLEDQKEDRPELRTKLIEFLQRYLADRSTSYDEKFIEIFGGPLTERGNREEFWRWVWDTLAPGEPFPGGESSSS